MPERLEALLVRSSAVFLLAFFAAILARGGFIVALVVVALFAVWVALGHRGVNLPHIPPAWNARVARGRDAVLRPFTLSNIVWIAVVLRLVWAMHYDVHLWSDFQHFRELAVRFAGGDASALLTGKSTVTVLLYGTFFKLLGASKLTVFAVNAALGAVQAALAYAIAMRLSGAWQAARLAGLGIAVFPSLVMFSNLPSSDLVFVTLLLVVVWQLVRGAPALPQRGRGAVIAFALLVGAETALLHLTRANGIVLGGWIALVALAWARPGVSRALWFAGGFAVAFSVCVTPTLVYNYRTYGYFSVESSRWGALNLLCGTNVEAGGQYNDADANYLKNQYGFEGRKWKRARHEAIDNARRRVMNDVPGFLAFALTTKFDTMWTDDTFGAGSRILGHIGGLEVSWVGLSQWFYSVMIVAACLAILTNRRCRAVRMFVVMAGGVLAATFLLHVVIEVQPRYHLPLDILLPLLVAPLVAPRGDDQSLI